MANQTLQTIQVSKVYPNFYQPREKFDKDKVKELSESILSNGLINPITVRKWTKGRFMIVAGERRWRAHKMAKLGKVEKEIILSDSDYRLIIKTCEKFRGFQKFDEQFLKRIYNCPIIPDEVLKFPDNGNGKGK